MFRIRVARSIVLFLFPLLPGLGSQRLAAQSGKAFAGKPLTLERIHSDPPLTPRVLQASAWRDAGRFTWMVRQESGNDSFDTLWEFDTRAGRSSKILDAPFVPDGGPLRKAVPDEANRAKVRFSLADACWNPAGTSLLVASAGDFWLLTISTGNLKRLTTGGRKKEFPLFSPDGTRVGFASEGDLWSVEVATAKETRLTTTGSAVVLNGRLDWVTEEEFTSRRSGRAFEWAPDSMAIAYLRLDQGPVPVVVIQNFLSPRSAPFQQRYPRAGDPNAIPSLHIVGIDGIETATVGPPADSAYIVPGLSWTPDSRAVAWTLLNRAQTLKEVRLLSRFGGASKLLYQEEDPAWINMIDPPRFLRDGSFLFLSERSGFVHLWRGWPGDMSARPITHGAWQVEREWTVQEATGTVLFAANEKDLREQHVYRVSLEGTTLSRLTSGRGTHLPIFSPDGTHFAETFSTVEMPPATAIVRSDGTRLGLLPSASSEMGDYRLGTTEFRSFLASDGALLYARLVRPADFDPERKYPVVVSVYGGPHAQSVVDRWGVTGWFDHLLAEKGFLVWAVDNRGTWGRGHDFEKPLLGKLGELELRDQLEGLAELRRLPFVDGQRIGIFGWSYGGYVSLLAALRAGDQFRCAAAGAPVTDWSLYDSIYTERYLKLPKENPGGYRSSSVLDDVGKLKAPLLLLHGTSDDNVHLGQTLALVEALTQARKSYDLVLFPGQKHGLRDRGSRLYSNQRLLEFFEKNL